jgi:hypothetical protein
MAEVIPPRRAGGPTFATAATLTGMSAVAAGCWAFTVSEMRGMDMGAVVRGIDP